MPAPEPDLKRSLYARMLRVRMVEEAIAARYSEQEMRCPVHLSVGQEAAAVGTCAALDFADVAVSTHRCHAHYLAKGGDLNVMMAEIYGKAAGCCGGRGGSMNLFDNDAGFMASIPIVGSSIPLGVGMGLAIKQQGSNAVSVVFLGDAAVEEGVFHESANFAVIKKLPVVFVCENNLFSVYTGLADRQPDRPLTDVAKAHAMPAHQADGNDVEGVLGLVSDACATARDGGGPSLLVLDTYRWLEHCGPNFDNDIGYRTEDEFRQWKELCPVTRYRDKLETDDLWSPDDDEKLRAEISTEIEGAFQFAKESPFPDIATVSDHVYG
jgi:pyruvate dehydrogenase E1 component alpha subunit